MSAPWTALITGAGGFVGGALAEGLATLGWRVTAVDRAFDDLTRRRLSGLDLVAADLAIGVPAGLPAASLVVHAAAMTTDAADLGWTRAEHLAANTRPLLAMLEHAARTAPEAFVFLSSSGVFGPEDGTDRLCDTDRATGDSAYAVAKRAGETLVLGAFAGHTAAHVLRLGYLFGPHETRRPSRTRVSPVAQWLDAARHGRPLAVSADDPLRDWTYAPDLAPALARLAGAVAAGAPRHLASPYVLRDSVMAALVARHVPGATCVTEPSTRVVKPPMAASDIPALEGFAWTAPDAALARLAAAEVAA